MAKNSGIDLQPIFDFALKYHEEEPIIANIIVLSIPSIIALFVVLRHLDKKRNHQVQDKKNIMNYD